MHSIEYYTNEDGDKHIQLLKLIESFNNNAHVRHCYKMRSIAKDIHCKNSFIVINPRVYSGFTAHILPMCFFDSIAVTEIPPELIDPSLVVEWYKVETGLDLYVLDFKSSGNLKDTRHENICRVN